MTRPLKIVITITDVAFILYWTMATLSELNAIEVPPNLMYADYDHPRVVAWNWSFLPIDLAFSIVGLAAVDASRRGRETSGDHIVDPDAGGGGNGC